MKWIASVLFLAALSGCASAANFNDPLKLNVVDIPASKGILILSAGADNACETGSYSTALQIERAGMKYPLGGSAIMILADAAGRANENSALIGVDRPGIPSDFDDHYGTLNAIALDAGEYQLYSFDYIKSAIEVPRAYITVVAGKAVYLGEAYLNQSCGLTTRMVFRDRSERDLKLLQTKNPALAALPIEKKILEFSDYIVGGKSTKP